MHFPKVSKFTCTHSVFFLLFAFFQPSHSNSSASITQLPNNNEMHQRLTFHSSWYMRSHNQHCIIPPLQDLSLCMTWRNPHNSKMHTSIFGSKSKQHTRNSRSQVAERSLKKKLGNLLTSYHRGLASKQHRL